jgi:hypothetical protein
MITVRFERPDLLENFYYPDLKEKKLDAITLYYTNKEHKTEPISFQALRGYQVTSQVDKIWAKVKCFFGFGILMICPDITLFVIKQSVKDYQSTIEEVKIRWHWFERFAVIKLL